MHIFSKALISVSSENITEQLKVLSALGEQGLQTRGGGMGEGQREMSRQNCPVRHPWADVVALGWARLWKGLGNQEAITWMPRADCVLEPQPWNCPLLLPPLTYASMSQGAVACLGLRGGRGTIHSYREFISFSWLWEPNVGPTTKHLQRSSMYLRWNPGHILHRL